MSRWGILLPILMLAALAALVASVGKTPEQADEVGDPVLVGAGDIAHCASSGDEATARLLDDIGGTVFTLGDNAYPKGTSGEFDKCYEPSWGQHKARTKPSVGNHEYNTPGASGYFGYFGDVAGDPDKGYYSYNVGDWHVAVLNSNCAAVAGGCAAGSPQEQWLQADLAAHQNACTLAYFHHPLFSSGEHGGIPDTHPFWEALYETNADVVLSGHDHDYERFAPQDPDGLSDPKQGIREFVVGTGGAEKRGFATVEANSEVRVADTNGVLKLTLHPTSYDWEFLTAPARALRDSGSAGCHDATPGGAAPSVVGVTPGEDVAGVDARDDVEAAFSEAIEPSTVTASTFTLARQDGTLVPATVGYDDATDKATLDPQADLDPGTGYTATVKGGGEGVRDPDGDPLADDETWSFTTRADSAAPIVRSPRQELAIGMTLSASTVPVRLNWSATDDQSGVIAYQLQQSTNGGAYKSAALSTDTTTTVVRKLSPGGTYQFRARVADGAGNWSEWSYGPQALLRAHQETDGSISYAGTWVDEAATSAYGGSLRHAGTKGAVARFAFSGTSAAWVASKGPDRGKAEVWIDDVKVKTVDLYASTAQPRKMVFTANGLDASIGHTLEVRVSGTKRAASSGTRVDVDAFVVLR